MDLEFGISFLQFEWNSVNSKEIGIRIWIEKWISIY